MNTDDIEQLVLSAIQQVAPEIEMDDIEVNKDIRETCDLDSMDFINYLIAIKNATGVVIAEKDYSNANTFKKMVEFLSLKLA